MTDIEIFQMLYNLEPENWQQKKKIEKMMSIILEKKKPTGLEEFLETLSLDEVLDKRVKRVYEYYCDWCKELNIKPESAIFFGRCVCDRFKVKGTVTRQDDKTYRVYRMDA